MASVQPSLRKRYASRRGSGTQRRRDAKRENKNFAALRLGVSFSNGAEGALVFIMVTLLTKLALLILIIALGGCATAAEREATAQREARCNAQLGGTYNDTFRAAAKIDPRKGIGECEANLLASAYFFGYISFCGGTSFPKDHGYAWVADTRVGYGGVSGSPVIVKKRTGVTYSPGRPIVMDPKVYLKFVNKN